MVILFGAGGGRAVVILFGVGGHSVVSARCRKQGGRAVVILFGGVRGRGGHARCVGGCVRFR